MKAFLFKFYRDEDGAVTVDWVVLSAAVVALGVLAALGPVSGTRTLSGHIETFMGTTGTDLLANP